MKKIAISFLFLLSTIIFNAQSKKEYNFGRIFQKDVDLTRNDIDSTANAAVLYESGNSRFFVENNKVVIKTVYYFKIKIFNPEGFDHALFSIPLYYNDSNYEKVEKIIGITHNGISKTNLSKDQIFKETINEHWKEVKFTMPNLKSGSIIEVSYTLVTPFKFNLTGWEFQSDIPKIVSQYKASIPGNYIYNRKLIGYLKLTTNDSSLKKECFRVPGYRGTSDCEQITYRMEDIPAFVEEDYMTSKDNFISKIKFELKETIGFDGGKSKYSTTWQATDRKFKTDKNIGVQLKKVKYFEELIPNEIKNIPNELDKAKAVHTFIKDYFTWNEKYGIFGKAKLKGAIDSKTGNSSEINISLINALKSVGLNAELVLLSTRNNGFPTKLYPVITDFNYVIAKLNINSSVYLLDATDKFKPFGELPYRCLNGYGRVMDFENDSYWYDIEPRVNAKTVAYVNLILNEEGNIQGKIKKVSSGYNAYSKRQNYSSKTEDEIISEFENDFNNLTVINYTLENKNDIDKPLTEIFEVELNYDDGTNKIYFNPFFIGNFEGNPLKQEDRLYPVDFGYKRKYMLHFKLEIPDNYKIESVPKSSSLKSSDNGISYILKSKKYENYKYTLYSNLNIGKTLFHNQEYQVIKNIFNEVIISQNTHLVIKKDLSLLNN